MNRTTPAGALACIGLICLCVLAPAVTHAQQTPVFDFQNIMDTYFDDTNGLVSFQDYTVAFAPDGQFEGFVAVLDSDGNIVAQHAFFPDYVNREGVFARVRAVGPADVALDEPGFYTIVFVVGNQPVTRFLVRLEQTSAGDDPFNPQATFRFDGYWRTLAYFTTSSFRDEPIPELTLWMGGMDLGEAQSDSFVVSLYRGGELLAHSKRRQALIRPGHFKRERVSLFYPHAAEDDANARFFTMRDLLTDGSYEISVTRASDGEALRTFAFSVADQEIVNLPRATLGFEPATDVILPRVLRSGATGLEMVEAIWIQRP
jgi:hypothetical protein